MPVFHLFVTLISNECLENWEGERGVRTDLKVLNSGEGEGAGTGEDGQEVLSRLLGHTSRHHKLDGEVGTLQLLLRQVGPQLTQQLFLQLHGEEFYLYH